MKTYSNGISKAAFVAEMRKHQAADAFVRGRYGKEVEGEFRGCAVGCGVRSIRNLNPAIGEVGYSDHAALSDALGWPQWIAHLQDILFERVSARRSKTWPVEIAEAVPEGVEGVDLFPALPVVMLAVLAEARSACPADEANTLDVVDRVIALWSRNDMYSEAWVNDAAAAAEAAAWAAEAAEAAEAAAGAWAAAAAAAVATEAAAAWAAAAAAEANSGKDPYLARSQCAERIADAVLKAVKECRTV